MVQSRYDSSNDYSDKKRHSKNVVNSKAHFQLFVAIAQGNKTFPELRMKLKKSPSTLQEQLEILERNGAIERSLIRADKPKAKLKYKYAINFDYFLGTLEKRLGNQASGTTKVIIQSYFNEYYPYNDSIKHKAKTINLFPAQTFLDLAQKLPYYALANRPKDISDEDFAVQGWYLLFVLEEIMHKVTEKDRIMDLSFFQKFNAKKGQRLKDAGAKFWFKPEIQKGMKALVKFHLDNMEDDKNGTRK